MMPRLRLLALFALAGAPLVVGIWLPAAHQAGLLLSLLVFVVSLVDLVVSATPARVAVEREARDVMSVGAQNAVTLCFNNRNRRSITIEVHDEPPLPSSWSDLPFTVEIRPGRRRDCSYHVEPHRRGQNRFGRIFLRCTSRLGLWTLQDERDRVQPVRIYPDIQAVHGIELLARRNRLAEAGVRLSRLRGRGNEFDRLREYRREDEYRSIDWKATARHQELISREYVVERNQNILLLLDCGRSMCNELGGISHFDRALNAAILLSYVALRQGDTVGVLACSNEVQRWVPPARGAAAVESLIGRLYDLEPSYEASDYALFVEQLRRRYRKRSLVILLTHAIDELQLRAIAPPIRGLRTPHLVLCAFLRNVPLYERMNAIPASDLDAFQIAAAADMVATQAAQLARLQQTGLLVIDALPSQLSGRLISQYLDIKARHLL